jgi:hypothetical protein
MAPLHTVGLIGGGSIVGVNVAGAIALAGIGFDATRVALVADPKARVSFRGARLYRSRTNAPTACAESFLNAPSPEELFAASKPDLTQPGMHGATSNGHWYQSGHGSRMQNSDMRLATETGWSCLTNYANRDALRVIRQACA